MTACNVACCEQEAVARSMCAEHDAYFHRPEANVEAQLRAMEADSVRRAKAKIDPTDTCDHCRAIADSWYRNLPRTDCEWPGTFPVPVTPKLTFPGPDGDIVVGPLAFPAHPRMDSRTPAHTKRAEWDVKNYEQIALCFEICRATGHMLAASEAAA